MQSREAQAPTRSTSSLAGPAWAIAVGLFLLAISREGESRQGNGGGNDELRTTVPVAGGGTADSNGSMIAVTGMDITGQSVLYLIDTEQKQLAIYQANGGSSGTRGVQLVGARRIDLDLQLEGFNDRTESDGRPLKYSDLEHMYQEKGLVPQK